MSRADMREPAEDLARRLYLNTARDADVDRRGRALRALARWRSPARDSDRAGATLALEAAASEYGLPLRRGSR